MSVDISPVFPFTAKTGLAVLSKNWYSFNGMMRLVCGILLIFSSFFLLFAPVVGLPLSLFFGFVLTSRYGFQIDCTKGKCREYAKAFWIKKGDWKNLTDFPFVAVLKSQKGYTTASMSNRTVTATNPVFEVFLLSETHRTKIQVALFKDLERAKSFAKEFASVVERKYTAYSPQISSSSRRRR